MSQKCPKRHKKCGWNVTRLGHFSQEPAAWLLSEIPLPVSDTLSFTYISHCSTEIRIAPPTGVYFTALSSRLNTASAVHLLSWERRRPSGQSTVTEILQNRYSILYSIGERAWWYNPPPLQGHTLRDSRMGIVNGRFSVIHYSLAGKCPRNVTADSFLHTLSWSPPEISFRQNPIVIKEKTPKILLGFSRLSKRRQPDLNWWSGCCRPTPYHLAMSPYTYYILAKSFWYVNIKNDSYGNRTRVTAVKGRCLNRLTKEPLLPPLGAVFRRLLGDESYYIIEISYLQVFF